MTPPVLLLGMHRSGTSAMGRVLVALGLDPGKPEGLMGASESNEFGHFEVQEISDLNEEILSELGGSWLAPPSPMAVRSISNGMFRARAEVALNRQFGEKPWFLKDPRLCVLLPFWFEVLAEPPVLLVVVRSSRDVARSLYDRDRIPVGFGARLMGTYLNALTRDGGGLPSLVVEYESVLNDPKETEEQVTKFFESNGVGPLERNQKINDVLDQAANHQGGGQDTSKISGWHGGPLPSETNFVGVGKSESELATLLLKEKIKAHHLDVLADKRKSQIFSIYSDLELSRDSVASLSVSSSHATEERDTAFGERDTAFGERDAVHAARVVEVASTLYQMFALAERISRKLAPPSSYRRRMLSTSVKVLRRIYSKVRKFGVLKRTAAVAGGALKAAQRIASFTRLHGFRNAFFRLVAEKKKRGIVGSLVKYGTGRTHESFSHAQDLYATLLSGWELRDEDVISIKGIILEMEIRPTFSIIMPVYNTNERYLRSAIDSVLGQVYENWELCIADDSSTSEHVKEVLSYYANLDERIKVVYRPKNGHISAASNSALELAVGDWVAFLDHDDVLHNAALFCFADQIYKDSDIEFIYSDEDKIDEHDIHFQPHFKPDYNESLFLGQNYISHFSAIRRSLVNEVGGFREGYEGAQDYDLFLRCISKIENTQIKHLPLPLYSWRAVLGSTALSTFEKSYAETAGLNALKDHCFRLDDGSEAVAGVVPTVYRVKKRLPSVLPLVSIIIPTRDGVEHLSRCIESICDSTSYPNFEIIILDNDSSDPDTLRFLKKLDDEGIATVLTHPGPFNYSEINNVGVKAANGSFVCLLNDDVEVISGGWLSEMMGWVLCPTVGAVGAKLLYPDRSLQHGGVVTGIGGVAGHGHKHVEDGSYGYFSRLTITHDVGAVTGACLLTSKEIWEEVGGLDEESLKVAFNDVDYCLKIRSRGYRVVWTPFAELYHYESKSRGADTTPEKRERFRAEAITMLDRWGGLLLEDPSFSPNLSLESEQFELADKPRFIPPWIVEPATAGH